MLLILVAALAATVACGGNGGSKHAGTETVRGLVQEVKSASLLELSAITVEDDDGVQWRIEGGGEKVSGFSPSHLREHMALGLPVTVTFHREDGKLVLDEIKD